LGSFEQQLSIVREIGDSRGEGVALCNLGDAYADLAQFGKAIECWRAALQIGQESKNAEVMRRCSHQLQKHDG